MVSNWPIVPTETWFNDELLAFDFSCIDYDHFYLLSPQMSVWAQKEILKKEYNDYTPSTDMYEDSWHAIV